MVPHVLLQPQLNSQALNQLLQETRDTSQATGTTSDTSILKKQAYHQSGQRSPWAEVRKYKNYRCPCLSSHLYLSLFVSLFLSAHPAVHLSIYHVPTHLSLNLSRSLSCPNSVRLFLHSICLQSNPTGIWLVFVYLSIRPSISLLPSLSRIFFYLTNLSFQ